MPVTGHMATVKRRMQDYGDQVRRWQHLQSLTAQCIEFELLLRHGLSLLTQVNEADEKWRSAVMRGQVQYDPSFEEELTQFYQWWIQSGEIALEELDRIESTGMDVDHAADFRIAINEVRGILTDDREFFCSDKLVELKDRAIDDFRAGKCEHF